VKAAVGMCSFASEERRSRRLSAMTKFVGMVVGIMFFLGALSGSVGVLLFVVLGCRCYVVVVSRSARGSENCQKMLKGREEKCFAVVHLLTNPRLQC
jgi:hypothetical protein